MQHNAGTDQAKPHLGPAPFLRDHSLHHLTLVPSIYTEVHSGCFPLKAGVDPLGFPTTARLVVTGIQWSTLLLTPGGNEGQLTFDAAHGLPM